MWGSQEELCGGGGPTEGTEHPAALKGECQVPKEERRCSGARLEGAQC